MLYEVSVGAALQPAGQSARRARAVGSWRVGLLLAPLILLCLAGTASAVHATGAGHSACGRYSQQDRQRARKTWRDALRNGPGLTGERREDPLWRSADRRGNVRRVRLRSPLFPVRLALLTGAAWWYLASTGLLREPPAPPPRDTWAAVGGKPEVTSPGSGSPESGQRAPPSGTAELPAAEQSPAPAPITPEVAVRPLEHQFGHLPYDEAPAGELVPVSADGQALLHRAAAARWQEMVAAAASSEVQMVALSAFRSVADQQYTFHGIAGERGQTPQERAKVSAPPGHSEHHTGYVVDVGDAAAPETDLSESFESTGAFKWLERNAGGYGFVLSFPRDNPQGVSYEPWHWRFVGDETSQEVFARALQLESGGARLARPDDPLATAGVL
jgi:D-alanyl-D-alanine carboxypeptidase